LISLVLAKPNEESWQQGRIGGCGSGNCHCQDNELYS